MNIYKTFISLWKGCQLCPDVRLHCLCVPLRKISSCDTHERFLKKKHSVNEGLSVLQIQRLDVHNFEARIIRLQIGIILLFFYFGFEILKDKFCKTNWFS